MARLPDIPLQSWIEDQQRRFSEATSGLFPSLEFKAAAQDAEDEIPHDWPLPGGEDQWAEAERQRQEEERQRQESERLRQQQEAELAAQQAEMQRQEMLRQQTYGELQQAGIPTPDTIGTDFAAAADQPPGTTGDHVSTSGALDIQKSPLDSFSSYADGLMGNFFNRDAAAPLEEEGRQGMENLGRIGQAVLDAPQQIADTADHVSSAVFDTAAAIPNAIGSVLNRTTSPEEADTMRHLDPNRVWESGTGMVPEEMKPGGLPGAIGRTVHDLPENLAKLPEEHKKNIEEAAASITQSAKDTGAAYNEGDILRTLGNGALTAMNTLGSPFTVAGKDIDVLLPEFTVQTELGQIGPGEIITNADALYDAGKLIASGIKVTPKVLRALANGETYEKILTRAAQGVGAVARAPGQMAEGVAQTAKDVWDWSGRPLGGNDLIPVPVSGASEAILTTRPRPSNLPGNQNQMVAGKMPLTREASPGFRQMFHGGGLGNSFIDMTKFDENGLYGPAYYMSSEPGVAGHYAEMMGEGSVIRPHELADSAMLFNVEKPVGRGDLRKIVGSLEEMFGDDPDAMAVIQEYDMASRLPEREFPRIEGKELYDELSTHFSPVDNWKMTEQGEFVGDKSVANKILANAGFDGVYYRGEDIHGLRDDAGKRVPHDAVGIFPEKLESFRNAFTKEPGYGVVPPGLAEAGAGAAAGAGSEATSEDPDRSIAGGALTGAVLGATIARMPNRGQWAARLRDGFRIPVGTPAKIQNAAERAYGEALRLFGKAQGERRATKSMHFGSMAEKQWEVYEDALRQAQDTTKREPVRVPHPADQTALTDDLAEASVGGEPPVGRDVPGDVRPETPAAAADAAPAASVPEGRDAGRLADERNLGDAGAASIEGVQTPASVADDIDLTPELPATIGPTDKFNHQEVGQMMKQLSEDLALSPDLKAKVDRWSTTLLGMDEKSLTGKNVRKIVEQVGKERAVHGQTPEQWADDWFRRKGFTGEEATAAAPKPTMATAEDAIGPTESELRAIEAEQGGMGANAFTGAALGAATDDPTDTEPDGEFEIPWERALGGAVVGGILGKRAKPTMKSPLVDMFGNPTARGLGKPVGPFQRTWEGFIKRATDGQVKLAAIVNEMAKEFKKQTGYDLPVGFLASEMKRLDPKRGADMHVQTSFKPAIQKFYELKVPDAERDAFFQAVQNTDIAQGFLLDIKNPTMQTAAQARLRQQAGLFKQSAQARIAGNDALADRLDQTARANPIQTLMQRDYPGPGGQATNYMDQLSTIAEFEATHETRLGAAKWAELNGAMQQVWKFGDEILQLKRDAGLITPQAYADLRATYPHYVPTKILDYLADDAHVAVGKSMSVNSTTLHELTAGGTGKEAMSPMAALLGQAYEAHAAAQKNATFNTFVNLWGLMADQGPHAGLGGFDPTRVTNNRLEMFGQEMQPWTTGKKPNTGVPLRGYVAGQKVEFFVPQALADAIKADAPANIPFLSGMMGAFRAGATARNPVFLTANLFLDAAGFMIRETARAGGPHRAPEVLSAWGHAMGEAIFPGNAAITGLGAAAGAVGGVATANEDASTAEKIGRGLAGAAAGGVGARFASAPGRNFQVWKDIAAHEYRGDMARYLEQGGGMAGHSGRGGLRPELTDIGAVDTLNQRFGARQYSELEHGVRELQRGLVDIKSPKELLDRAWDIATLKPVEAIGERIELAPRVAAMKLAERRGEDWVRATNKGRTTTIDFNKGGTWSKTISQIVPFFNVGTQAVAELGRMFQDNPYAATATVSSMIVAPMAAAEAWNQMDPQRARDYADVPDYVKDQGLVIMYPRDVVPPQADAQGNEHPQFMHIRFRQFAPIAIATRAMLQGTLYRDSNLPARDREQIAQDILTGSKDVFIKSLQQMSPTSASDPGDLATALTPLGVSTAVQLYAGDEGWDFFRGKRINSTYADERASPLSKALAENVGGKPSSWEFGTRDIGTGYAGMLHGASEMIAGDKDKPSTPQDIPVVGGLLGRFQKGSIGQGAEDARDAVITPSAEKILKSNGITWRPAAASPEINDVPLTRTEYAEYQRRLNREIDEAIQDFGTNPDWVKSDATFKRERLEKEIDRRREFIRKQFWADIPKDVRDERLQKQVDAGKATLRSRR